MISIKLFKDEKYLSTYNSTYFLLVYNRRSHKSELFIWFVRSIQLVLYSKYREINH